MTDRKKAKFGPLGAIGMFLAAFGVWLVVATFFTPSIIGKITNLAAALVTAGIGLAAIMLDRRPGHSNESRSDD